MNAIDKKPAEEELVLWDQWEAEPAQHYKYFLYYLNTGIARTVRKAAMAFHDELDQEARSHGEAPELPLMECIREWQQVAHRWEGSNGPTPTT